MNQAIFHDQRAASSQVGFSALRWHSLSSLGVGCCTLGAGFAIGLTPTDPSSSGALFLSGLVFACFLALPITVATLRSAKSAFHAVNIVATAPVFWLLLDLIQSAYPLPGVTQANAQTAFLSIGLFSTAVWIGGVMPAWRFPKVADAGTKVELAPRHLMIMAVLSFTLAFCRYAIPSKFDLLAMINAFDGSRWSAPWSRGAIGGWDSFLDHFSYFGYALPTLTALLARKCGWINRRTVTALAFTLIISSLMSVGGGRRIIGVMGGSAMLAFFLSSPRFTIRSLFGVTAAIVCLMFVLQVMILYRNDGLAKVFSGDLGERLATKDHFHVDDNFYRLSQIVDIIPEKHPHTTWRYPLYIAARPIPRVFWPGKPVDPGFDLTAFLGRNNITFSSTVIGEMFMAFGLLGCFGAGLLYGRIARMLTAMIESNQTSGAIITYGIGLLAVFAGVRSGIDLVLMNYGVLGWLAVVYAYDKFYERLKSRSVGPTQTIQRINS